MGSIKGYPSQEALENTRSEHVSVVPTGPSTYGIEVRVVGAYAEFSSTDTAEAGSTTQDVIATAHGAKVGDMLLWLTGSANAGVEVIISAVPDANTIRLGQNLSFVPVAGVDTFSLSCPKTQQVSPTGEVNTIVSEVTGKTSVDLHHHSYDSVNVTTGAYVELLASTSAKINRIHLFDSSGEVMILATGAPASEVDVFYIEPGGPGQVDLTIPAGTRLSVKALSATAVSGDLVLNGLS